MANQEVILNVVRGAFSLLAILALVVFVVRPLLRHLLHPVDSSLYSLSLPDIEEGEEIEVPTEDAPETPDREKVISVARKDPQMTASQIRRWLREK